jgi:hypothetical protein
VIVTVGKSRRHTIRLVRISEKIAEETCSSQGNDERIVYVTAEDIERVIAACPDNDWRLVFALPRYAGIRFPGDVEDFRWSDVDWENSRFTVRQKKLEHHPGRSIRVVPGKVVQSPADAPTVTGHQEPSPLHEAREKSLDVQIDAEKKYPRQEFVDRGLAREKRWFLGSTSLHPHLFLRRQSPLAATR